MQYEVEVKYPLLDEAALRSRLAEMQAEFSERIRQQDYYLNHPSRDFAVTDEALRIRRIGEENRLTFKGPLIDAETKTREEIELGFDAGEMAAEQLQTLLHRLGFAATYQVAKTREVFHLHWQGRDFEVLIDHVDGLGLYVELECLANENSRQAARDDLLQLAAQLQLGPQVERRSYLRLLLAKQESAEPRSGRAEPG